MGGWLGGFAMKFWIARAVSGPSTSNLRARLGLEISMPLNPRRPPQTFQSTSQP